MSTETDVRNETHYNMLISNSGHFSIIKNSFEISYLRVIRDSSR